MTETTAVGAAVLALVLGLPSAARAQQDITVELAYREPGSGPAPNFSPSATRVPLADVTTVAALPEGAVRPVREGVIKIGPGESSWIRFLVSADADHPKDLCRLYVDRNRNGDFTDDGPAAVATPTTREKTGDVWSSFPDVEVQVPYGSGPGGAAEPYRFAAWIVRSGDAVPDTFRFSVRSWRSGIVTVAGVEAYVAAMDGDSNAIFDDRDWWSVLEASAPDAAKQVLTYKEARSVKRLMFVNTGTKELVLEFRSFSPDGRAVTFAVVDRPVTKAEDRLPDDGVREERSRPRATNPFQWGTHLDDALAAAKAGGRRVILDFWTSWCGPCKSMDEWIWTDAEVVSVLGSRYIGVKLDGDLEKALVERFKVAGYPTMIVLDANGRELTRAAGYQSSKQMLQLLRYGLLTGS